MRTLFLIVGLLFLFRISEAQNWFGLDGPMFSVFTLYPDTTNDLLYVAGSDVAVWDGEQLDTLGFGIDGNVTHITKFKDTVFICGGFNYADNLFCRGLLKWDGQQLDSVTALFDNGSIFGGTPSFMVPTDSFLYVVGSFDSIGTMKVHGIAKWDGQIWSDVGNFPNYTPPGNANILSCAAFYHGDLYVGGYAYDSVGNVQWLNRFDGANWGIPGQGIHGSISGVSSLIVYQNELYVAGAFTINDGNNPGNYIAKWDGTNWSDVGGGVAGLGFTGNGQIHDLFIFQDELYAVGFFSYAGGVPAEYIAKWNGEEWCSLGSDFDNGVWCGVEFNEEFYIGGLFQTIDVDSIYHYAKWIGGNYVDTSCGAIIGINEVAKPQFDFSLSPNPTTKSISVYSEEPFTSVQLLNILGEKVIEQSFAAKKEMELDVSQLPSGVYFVQVDGEGVRGVGKVVKE